MAPSIGPSWIRIGALAAAGLTISLVSVILAARRPSAAELLVLARMEEECHAVWKELLDQRVCAGDDLVEVIARTHPSKITRTRDTVTLSYFKKYSSGDIPFTGVSIEAEHGKLTSAYAWSCDWARQFFDIDSKYSDAFIGPLTRLRDGGAVGVFLMRR